MRPLIEIYPPERTDIGYCVHAHINLGESTIHIEAEAPDALAAIALARFQAFMAHRLGQRAQMLLPAGGHGPRFGHQHLLRRPAFSTTPRFYETGADEVAGFWDSIKKGFKAVTKNPIFKSVVGTALKCVPVVGPVLGDLGPKALEAAGGALAGAKKGKKAAKKAVKKVTAAARRGVPKAKKANQLLVATAKLGQTRAGKRRLKGLLAAGQVVKQASAGNAQARARVQAIMQGATMGQSASLQAAGLLAAAQTAMEPEMPPLVDEQDMYWEGQDMMDQDGGLYEADESEIEDEAVGALTRGLRRVTKTEVLRELDRLRRARKGYRRAA